MKITFLSIILLLTLVFCQPNRHIVEREGNRHYIQKVKCLCGLKPFDGYKLAVLPYHLPRNFKPNACTYEQDKVFGGYPNKEKMKLLEELLSFEDDSSICCQRVCRYGYTDWPPPTVYEYSLQLDALYLMTILSVSSYSPYYCPYPILVNKSTGEVINGDRQKISEVYSIYKDWFERNRKTDFKKFDLPLRNSHYEWYGADTTRRAYIFADSFRINQLSQSAIVIGNCRN